MTQSYWQRQPTHSIADLECDVLIVGGGYVGLSVAYWLSEYCPELKLIVLEQAQCGAGASGRNAGFLTKGSAAFFQSLYLNWGMEKALGIFKYAQDSINLAEQHIFSVSSQNKCEKTSSVTLFQSEEGHKLWRDSRFDPTAFSFKWIEPEKLSEALKGHFIGAYENDSEYKINPVQTLMTLKKILESRKIQIIENLSAYQLSPTGAWTELNQVKAKKVVLALNGYFSQFHSSFNEMIIPRRAQMLAVELEREIECPSLYYDPAQRVYWRASGRNLLIGGKRLLDEVGEVGEFDKLSPLIQKALESYISEQLKLKFKVINRWSGTMGFTEHELPIITKAQAPIETTVIGGFSGHGMGLGFKAAQEAAELILGKRQFSTFDSFKKMNIVL